MYPGMMSWWRESRRDEGCGARAGCGPSRGHAEGHGCGGRHGGWHAGGGEWDEGLGGGSFGVRRPLRFLAYKLELDEAQVGELARILDELKTERAQAAVDNRRSVGGLADAVAGDGFDAAKAAGAAATRVQSAERLRDAVVAALAKIHAVLNAEQRKQLAYLIRTGTLSI